MQLDPRPYGWVVHSHRLNSRQFVFDPADRDKAVELGNYVTPVWALPSQAARALPAVEITEAEVDAACARFEHEVSQQTQDYSFSRGNSEGPWLFKSDGWLNLTAILRALLAAVKGDLTVHGIVDGMGNLDSSGSYVRLNSLGSHLDISIGAAEVLAAELVGLLDGPTPALEPVAEAKAEPVAWNQVVPSGYLYERLDRKPGGGAAWIGAIATRLPTGPDVRNVQPLYLPPEPPKAGETP